MIVNFGEFSDFPLETTIVAPPGAFSHLPEPISTLEALMVTLAIQQTPGEYFVQGTVEARVQLECQRCLASVTADLTEALNFIVPREGTVPEGRDDDGEEYLEFRAGTEELDLTAPVEQALILALGVRPDCRLAGETEFAECDERTEALLEDINPERVDPRWAALKELRDRK